MLYGGSWPVVMTDPIRNWHEIAVEILLNDAELALISIADALGLDDRDALHRVARVSRDTYQSIQTRRRETPMTDEEQAALEEKMDRLRARLRFIGEGV